MKRPVLLVPGWSDRARHLRRLQRRFYDAGWPQDSVRAVDFKDRYGGNVEHAAELASELRKLTRERGGPVDIVAHSMGGLAVRYLLHTMPESEQVRRVVFLGTPHAGTFFAWLGWGGGARDMRHGSAFLAELAAAKPRGPADLISIRTPFDLRVFPGTSAILDGARNISVWCAGHRQLLRSGRVFRLIQYLLESENGQTTGN